MDQLKMSSRVAIGALAACSLFAVLTVVLGFAGSSQAALVESANGPQLLIGLDDDRSGQCGSSGWRCRKPVPQPHRRHGRRIGQRRDVRVERQRRHGWRTGSRHHPRRTGWRSGARAARRTATSCSAARATTSTCGRLAMAAKRSSADNGVDAIIFGTTDREPTRIPPPGFGCRCCASVFQAFRRAFPRRM